MLKNIGRIHIYNVKLKKLWRSGGHTGNGIFSRLMEIFVNKMDMLLSDQTTVDPGGLPFFFIKC